MCFIIHPQHAEKKIAKRDIVCYKIGYIRNNIFMPEYFSNFKYSFGKKKVQEDENWPHIIHYGSYYPEIKEGFHSFSNKKQLKKFLEYTYKFVKCIIPKGTEYYYNPDYKGYVSRALIVLEEIQI